MPFLSLSNFSEASLRIRVHNSVPELFDPGAIIAENILLLVASLYAVILWSWFSNVILLLLSGLGLSTVNEANVVTSICPVISTTTIAIFLSNDKSRDEAFSRLLRVTFVSQVIQSADLNLAASLWSDGTVNDE